MKTRDKLQQLRSELKELFFERDQLIDGILVALLSGQHVLVLGPPGTAKSMIAREVCSRLRGKKYFQWLLTKFSTPEEVFGPISLAALEKERYERVTTGKLPEAHVAFLDEVFKANSAILNSLLTVLNERQFHQGGNVVDVPLLTLVAASNELPEEGELDALHDRFLLRFTVGYIEQDFRFARLLKLESPEPGAGQHLEAEDLDALVAQVGAVKVPDNVLREVIEIRRVLGASGVVASDRRYRLAVQVLRAGALLEGRSEVTTADLTWLQHILWDDPEEQNKVTEALSKVAAGFEQDAQKLLFQAREVHEYALRDWKDDEKQGRAVLEAHAKLLDLHKRLGAMADRARERGRDTSKLDQHLKEVALLQRGLLKG